MYLSSHTQVLVLVDILGLLAPIMISFVAASHGLFVPAACQYADSQCISVQDCLFIWRLRGSVAAAQHCCSWKRCRETRFWLQINEKARCDSHTRVLILHPQRFPMSETHVNAWDIHAELHTRIHTLTYLPNCLQCHISGLSGVWQRLCVGYWVSSAAPVWAGRHLQQQLRTYSSYMLMHK